MQTEVAVRGKTYDMVYIGIFAVLIAVCSWISIPAAVPFTLQTLAYLWQWRFWEEKEERWQFLYTFLWEQWGFRYLQDFKEESVLFLTQQEDIL